MSVAAVIIARGGSIRLPGKNVKSFCGHPLVAWSIVQAQMSRLVDTVWLSTDTDRIAEIGERYGARIIRRPDWPDHNEVSANRVFSHALDWIEENAGPYDTLLTMLPTSPLRYPHDIDEILKMHLRVGERVVQAAQLRQCFISRMVHPRMVRTILADKDRRHYQVIGGTVAQRWEWFREMVRGLESDLDADLNAMRGDVEDSYDRDVWFVPCRTFQCWETDVLEEFEIAELLMKEYILPEGGGMEIYEEYRTMEVLDV